MIPVAHISQLIEIQKKIKSPKSFQHRDLITYNNRHTKIVQVRKQLQQLSKAAKDLLIKKLIKGCDLEIDNRKCENLDQINSIYRNITSLASDLHQGKLMNVAKFNIQSRDFSYENIFAMAWGEAL